MFDRRTVFILGAGASWHYGYPTGEGLVKKVIEKAKIAEFFFNNFASPNMPGFVRARCGTSRPSNADIRDAWKQATKECRDLGNLLTQLNPLVIDFFLGHFESLRGVGRFMIAWALQDCERGLRKKVITSTGRIRT
jgi:hypothetical protein